MQTVNKPEHRPTTPHYAIVELDSLSHEDGYGGITSTEYTFYRWTVDKIEWVAEIQKLEQEKNVWSRKSYFAMRVDKLAKIATSIVIDVDDKLVFDM